MIKFIEKSFRFLISDVMLMLLFAAGFLAVLYPVAEQDKIDRAETQQQVTEACYAQGMVVVNTDAGKRCADPRNLVKVK